MSYDVKTTRVVLQLKHVVTGSIPVSCLLAEVPFGAVTEYYITEGYEY